MIKQVTFALLVVLIALAWGGKDWLLYNFKELTADQQIKYVVVVASFFGIVLSRIFAPFIWGAFY